MRDLLFKNLTSFEKRRKILASSETADKEGVHSVIHRHFIYSIKEIAAAHQQSQPALYIIKEHNHKAKKERFFCKIKGNICATNNGKLYEITYLHSLNITLVSSLSFLSEK
ncbi:MAG: hypothetical protein PHT31_06605 [Candidatus Omnitrophica bacterium]|nr:hypothetical protein [Candidatus Omnitrophota bacterium]MDD5653807.1 hypothetical protein [Candidatus Omnitrophota bacterium]